jgi:hypothetical protein
MREILRDFGFSHTAPTQIYEDNLACVAMSENPVQGKFSRHIDICRYFVRDMVSAGVLKLVPLRTRMPSSRAYCLQRISSIVRSCWVVSLSLVLPALQH